MPRLDKDTPYSDQYVGRNEAISLDDYSEKSELQRSYRDPRLLDPNNSLKAKACNKLSSNIGLSEEDKKILRIRLVLLLI